MAIGSSSVHDHGVLPMTATREQLVVAIVDADQTVINVMRSYLRTARAGGMPQDVCDTVEGAVVNAAQLQMFSVALAAEANREISLDLEQDAQRIKL